MKAPFQDGLDGCVSAVPEKRFPAGYFSQATERDWDDWHWQLRHALRSREQIERILTLTDDERAAFASRGRSFPVSITPYYMSRIDPENPDDPLRKTMIPRTAEHRQSPGEHRDPLGEDAHSPAPRIIHTYPNKVLLLVTDFCATYCRYCTRARVVGSGTFKTDPRSWSRGLDYIRAHSEIRDVLVSGGDPLTMADGKLAGLLDALRAIRHVEIIRVGTKIPAVLPQRITPELVSVLRRAAPLWLSTHFTHPHELSDEVRQACDRLADGGIPMVSQTVLLKGVNDRTETLQTLFETLLTFRVTPYYLHQCDPSVGSAHFRTPVATGKSIIRALHGNTTGFAVPMYMIDAPGGGGKVPVGPSHEQGRDGDDLLLTNYKGDVYRYHDPV